VDPIRSNRDLYRFVAGLVKRRAGSTLALRGYLERLRQLAAPLRAHESISPNTFAELLDAAFESGPAPIDPRAEATPGFVAWERLVTAQIRDLHEMDRAGLLDDEQRYFGLNAPSGARWYNFDPGTFLECGATGTFGGWQEGDDTGRAYVPGPVVVLDASGALVSVDPRDVDDPVVELEPITWETFSDFLGSGQCYE
jgi:hypothetical protein